VTFPACRLTQPANHEALQADTKAEPAKTALQFFGVDLWPNPMVPENDRKGQKVLAN
jgi:hypothetical protein